MYSNQTSRLIHWIIADYTNFQIGNRIGTSPSEYHLSIYKQELKKMYIDTLGYEPKKKSLETYLKRLDDKDNITVDVLKNEFVSAIQDFLLGKKDFSLSLHLMTQPGANRFLGFLFDLMKDNQIPFRNEIQELMRVQDNNRMVYAYLRNKECIICSKRADLHHVDHAQDYKHDDGRNKRFLPLCREHHNQTHSDYKFYEKYKVEGIYLTDEQINFLKSKVYKNHFKNFKKGE